MGVLIYLIAPPSFPYVLVLDEVQQVGGLSTPLRSRFVRVPESLASCSRAGSVALSYFMFCVEDDGELIGLIVSPSRSRVYRGQPAAQALVSEALGRRRSSRPCRP